jgi:DNA-directed RNA polymerase subunit omega
MMLYPSMAELLEKVDSRYMLVNVIAKRAREISAEAEETQDYLEEKSVSIAIKEIAEGKIEVVKHDGEEESVEAEAETPAEEEPAELEEAAEAEVEAEADPEEETADAE